MAGLGLYELWLNGAPATDTVINMVWTRFDSVTQYRMFDLTSSLAVRPLPHARTTQHNTHAQKKTNN